MNEDFIKANYHTHTWRCKHAHDTEREFIEAAIAHGIQVLGFSDHVPCNFPDGYVSGIRMGMEQAAEYKDCLEALKKEYAHDIELYIGFEAEYIPAYFDYHRSLLEEMGFDYLIMGEHFLCIGGPEGLYTGTETYDAEVLERYVELVVEGAKTGCYKYIAHPDIIHFLGERRLYDKKIRYMCRELKKLGVPLEINALGYAGGRHYPDQHFFEIVSEVGNEVIIGMDAHCVAHLTDAEAYRGCLRMAQRLGLNLIERIDMTRANG